MRLKDDSLLLFFDKYNAEKPSENTWTGHDAIFDQTKKPSLGDAVRVQAKSSCIIKFLSLER